MACLRRRHQALVGPARIDLLRGFQSYDPAKNSITTLADQPNAPNYSTITVVTGP